MTLKLELTSEFDSKLYGRSEDTLFIVVYAESWCINHTRLPLGFIAKDKSLVQLPDIINLVSFPKDTPVGLRIAEADLAMSLSSKETTLSRYTASPFHFLLSSHDVQDL